jgi:hypothetical protein
MVVRKDPISAATVPPIEVIVVNSANDIPSIPAGHNIMNCSDTKIFMTPGVNS